jgi:hypothetical protein
MKTINELDVVLLYVSKKCDSMGLDYYLFKNNLGLPEEAIMGARSDFEGMTAETYKAFRAYVAESLRKIIKNLSSDWKSIGNKEVKLIFNKTETSISLSMDVDSSGSLDVLSTKKTIAFEPVDIDFFDDVTLFMKI